MTAQKATTGNDTPLYTASSINALAVQIRFSSVLGETVSGATLAANLKNVEVLVLSVNGANNITSLTASHVLTMTWCGTYLKINGTAEDTLNLIQAGHKSATNNGYVTYISTVSSWGSGCHFAGEWKCSNPIWSKSIISEKLQRSWNQFGWCDCGQSGVTIPLRRVRVTIHWFIMCTWCEWCQSGGHGIDHWTDFGFGSTATDSNAETIHSHQNSLMICLVIVIWHHLIFHPSKIH